MSFFTSYLPRQSGWIVGLGLASIAPFACAPGPRNYAPTDLGGSNGEGSGAAPASVGGNPSSGGNGQDGDGGSTGGNESSSGGNVSTGGGGPSSGGAVGSGGGGSTTGPCEDNDCEHGACVPDGDDAYSCDCAGSGYEGEFCQTEINECNPNPCEQGAECTDQLLDYSCDCPDAFAGKNCQLPSFEAVPTSSFSVYELSADGLVLSGSSNNEAAVYMDGELEELGTYLGDTRSTAYAASNGGEVIVGGSENSDGSARRAVVWEDGTIKVLDAPVDYPNCTATGITPDGVTIAGMCADADFYNAIVVRWVDRVLDELPPPDGTSWCFDAFPSADGQSVLASCSVTSYVQSMRWTEELGSNLLISTEQGCRIQGITPDGLNGAGWCSPGGNSSKGFVWNADDGFDVMTGAWVFPTDTITSAHDISANGQFLVGATGNLGDGVAGVFWDGPEAPIMITDLIAAEGITATGWTGFYDAREISADGNTIVGTGSHPDWYVWILRRN